MFHISHRYRLGRDSDLRTDAGFVLLASQYMSLNKSSSSIPAIPTPGGNYTPPPPQQQQYQQQQQQQQQYIQPQQQMSPTYIQPYYISPQPTIYAAHDPTQQQQIYASPPMYQQQQQPITYIQQPQQQQQQAYAVNGLAYVQPTPAFTDPYAAPRQSTVDQYVEGQQHGGDTNAMTQEDMLRAYTKQPDATNFLNPQGYAPSSVATSTSTSTSTPHHNGSLDASEGMSHATATPSGIDQPLHTPLLQQPQAQSQSQTQDASKKGPPELDELEARFNALRS
jgi:hypothetical protein